MPDGSTKSHKLRIYNHDGIQTYRRLSSNRCYLLGSDPRIADHGWCIS
ncbi:Uncharacterised protein [Vibrio cholerae]|nr:Uncharacterised protein [Vibrio cholerae]